MTSNFYKRSTIHIGEKRLQNQDIQLHRHHNTGTLRTLLTLPSLYEHTTKSHQRQTIEQISVYLHKKIHLQRIQNYNYIHRSQKFLYKKH